MVAPLVLVYQSLEGFALLLREVEGSGHRLATDHDRRPLPLEVDLLEPMALRVGQPGLEPAEHRVVDLAAGGDGLFPLHLHDGRGARTDR